MAMQIFQCLLLALSVSSFYRSTFAFTLHPNRLIKRSVGIFSPTTKVAVSNESPVARSHLAPLQLYFTSAAKPKTIKVNYMTDYIEPHDLANDLRLKPLSSTADGPPQEQQTVVIDVRSNMEYAEGHIRGARHLPSDHFMNEAFVRNIIEDHRSAERVIFHCALSKQRGPTCARIFYSQLMKLKQEKAAAGETIEGLYNPRVMVLRGGFEEFGSRYGDDETLVEVDEMFR